MRGKKAKKIRKAAFDIGMDISGEPYQRLPGGQIVANKYRRAYQKTKGR